MMYKEFVNVTMQLNKKYFIKAFILFSVIHLFQGNVVAQEAEVEDKVVIIEKEAKLELPSANRNFQKILIETPKFQTKNLDYEFTDVNFDLPRLPARIKVPTIPPDPLVKLYGNYVKAGFGNYVTPYLEAFFNSKRNEQFNYGLHLKHLSSKNGSVKSDRISGLSGNSINQVSAYIQYFTKGTILKSRAGFTSLGYNYYGFNQAILDTSSINEDVLMDSLKQRYNIFSFDASIENKDKKQTINYLASLQFNNFGNRFNTSENEFIVNGSAGFNISKSSGIELNGLISYSQLSSPTALGRTFVQFKPVYNFGINNFIFKAGANIAYTNDTTENNMHFYPTLHGEYPIIEKTLTAFAGLNGEMVKNTLRSFTLENPFLGNSVEVNHTNKALDLYVGGKGNIKEKINYLIRFSYLNYRNLYFYNNAVSDTSKFSIFYVRGVTNVANLATDLSYSIIEKTRIGLKTNFTGYSISSDTLKAWHRPNIYLSLYGSYNLYQKITFNCDFYYIGGLKGRNFITGRNRDNELPSVIDLNLKVDYHVSSVFSAFVEANNLFSRKYQMFQYYPVRGINLIAGISYSF